MADIAALERQLAELQARDAELETRFNQLQPQVEAARARLREAEQRLADLDRQFPRSVSFNDITRAREAAEANPSDAAAQQRLQDLRSQFAEQRQQRTEFLADAQAQFNTAQQEFRAAVAPQSELTFESEQLANDIAQVQQQIESSRQQGPATESAGQQQAEAQTANDDGADTQAPGQDPEVLAPDGRITADTPVAVTNADDQEPVPTSGTDDTTRPAAQTQSTPAATAQTPIQPGSPSNPTSSPEATPTSERGAAADNDDNTNPTVSRINTIFGGPQAVIRPAPNVLDRYSNYTYNISIYLSSPDNYLNVREQGSASLSGANLLLQSGGAAVGKRSQEFPLDFYIDDLKVTSLLPGKGTGGGHNATDISFQIYEPNGITFLDRLAAATRKYVKSSSQNKQTNNYSAQIYLMVIRFYGYDSNGELVRVANALETPGTAQEPGMIVEKFIPFRFTQIKFRLANRLAQYDCRAVPIRDYVAPSQTRGIIPYNVELTSVSLKDLLGVNLSFASSNSTSQNEADRTQFSDPEIPGVTVAGSSATRDSGRPTPVSTAGAIAAANLGVSPVSPVAPTPDPSAAVEPAVAPGQSSAPPKASAAPRPTLIRGLTAALNEFQAELVRRGTYQYPDVYEIIINESILREATIQPPEAGAGLRSVPMTEAQTAGAQKLGIRQQVNRDSKNVSATAGMSIVQFLDQVVRNSSYIFDQQTRIYKKNAKGQWVTEPRGTGAAAFAWYRIGMDAVPIKDRYDEKRGDWAYRITYTIMPYQVNDSKSGWFPQSKFYGTHKKYEYWFTGLNTQIISYEQDYDYLYYITVNSGQNVPTNVSDYREYQQYAFQARAPEASQGAAGPLFDPPALAASTLYSPGDTSKIKMNILGDPAWIQQGELSNGIKEYGENFYGAFLPDGTLNYDSRQILFEVTFNTAGDYDTETGLMDVTRRAV